MAQSQVVDVGWLRNRLEQGEVAVLDVRFSPKDAAYGRNAYQKGHLPGAVFVDLKTDLQDEPSEHGGRSPLQSPERLALYFGALGIDAETTVVIYEDVNGPAAARLWWVLQYLGIKDVYVLDGGYKAWVDAGRSVTAEQSVPEKKTFLPDVRSDQLVGVDDVRAALHRAGTTLVDSRDAEQYLGLASPFDPIAGHIPGAVLHFWKDGLDESGRWKNAAAQAERFVNLPKDEEIIVYCGSGISAAPNVLTLKEAGFTKVKLYAGSWSDWISYSDNPVATGEE
ncbi:sulfurtransferase [Paenibacillus agricola]|uniref:Sulfurtransferase n=1 Tax=Paenibacillus agricola TaxID=2716264 RepID=A0ABX0J0H0_9BACL|nr:sulfurtransferase [Paenibacillus agricola]NHN29729.1 sulfurtransferase [Paenibacillus agricola]